MAWEVEQRLKCPRCHTRRDEWDEDRNAYHVDEHQCLGCEKLDLAWEDWRNSGDSVRGLQLSLRKGPRPADYPH